MINACLIGVGRMGQSHAKHIQKSPYASLYCVTDPNEELAKQVAEQFQCKSYATAEEALQDPNVDAVVIVSNTDTHAELIIAAAKAGKPIFCEKPIDLQLEKIDRCLEVVEREDVPLFVAFNRRFDPSFQSLYSRLRSGEIGNVEMVVITSRDNPFPDISYLKTSGGMFKDMTIHDFDMARWLLNEEPVEVYASGSCLIDPRIAEFDDVDTSMVTLKTASGVLCHINNSRRSVYGYDQRIEVFGSEGMLRANHLPPTIVEKSDSNGVQTDPPHPSFPERYQEAYQNEIDHFFRDVVRDHKPAYISGEDGRQAIVIAEAATESLQLGKPVTIASLSKVGSP